MQDFLDFWCEADFSKFMSPEQAAAALDVQRKLREWQGRTVDAVSEDVTWAGSEGSCSSRSSSGSSSRRLLPPRGLGLSDPLAGWLTAGDEPAFVAHARQTLPSDWLQRTFRQQKRFLGKLRRSHFGPGAVGALCASGGGAKGEREGNYLETECALFGGSLGTQPTSPRALGKREANHLKKTECAFLGGSLGTLPTSPRATGEQGANYLEKECALFGGSLGTTPTSPRATGEREAGY